MEEKRYDKKELSGEEDWWGRVNFLLSKVELAEEEIQWLVAYLENTDGNELYTILYWLFRDDNYLSYDEIWEFDQGKILHLIHKEIDR